MIQWMIISSFYTAFWVTECTNIEQGFCDLNHDHLDCRSGPSRRTHAGVDTRKVAAYFFTPRLRSLGFHPTFFESQSLIPRSSSASAIGGVGCLMISRLRNGETPCDKLSIRKRMCWR